MNNNGRVKQADDGKANNQDEDVLDAEMPEPFGMCDSYIVIHFKYGCRKRVQFFFLIYN